MKTLKLLLFGFGLLITSALQAQVSVKVNVAPAWAPANAPAAGYYYLPDVESYYDVKAARFIHYGNGKWVRSRNLPPRYSNYDLHKGYKVVLTDYRGKTPHTHFHKHKVKYHKGYKGKPQKTIGVKKSHKKHHDNGKHHKGHGKGHKNEKGNKH